MRVVVLRDREAGERRVALTPTVAVQLAAREMTVIVETDAGREAGFPDAAYEEAGITVAATPPVDADIFLLVGPPSVASLPAVPAGAALLGFLNPFSDGPLVRTLADRRISALAFEAVPRTTLAQSMDALSSQATAAGYAGVLAAASALPRFFPMFTTAAGTIPPSKVLILGTGVAGLQAIATARRLGAVVSAYDIRPEAREQVESLGARFVAAPVAEEASTDEGYAREVGDDLRQRQLEALAGFVAASDVVIATAQIPGRPAPLLVTRQMVEAMRPGSVIVDVAAPTGGNCELTDPGRTVTHGDVMVLGPLDLPSRVAHDASEMYARNVAALLGVAMTDGAVALDFGNPIIDGTCIAHDGIVRHPLSRRAAGLEEEER